MKAKKQVIKIKDVKLISKFYPRDKEDWMLAWKYAQQMKSGANFPPIIVSKQGNQLILIDGFHRMQANRKNKQEHIDALVYNNMSTRDMYVESVRLNAIHGKGLTVTEVAKAVQKLKSMKFNMVQISKIVQIPVNKMQEFVAQRMVNTVTGEEIVKPPLKHLAGSSFDKDEIESFEAIQNKFTGSRQTAILDEILVLLREGLIDFNHKDVKAKLEDIHNLLNKIIGKKKTKRGKRK